MAKSLLAMVVGVALAISPAAFASSGSYSLEVPDSKQEAIGRLMARSPDLIARFDSVTGTPRWLADQKGTLTGPSSLRPADAARAWLGQHAGLYDLTADSIAAMDVERDFTMPGGVHVVWLRQTWNGAPALRRGLATFSFDRSNRLVSVGADLVPTTRMSVTGARRLGAGQAVAIVADQSFGRSISPQVVGRRAGFVEFGRAGMFANHFARPGFLPTRGSVRPVWDVYLIAKMTDAVRAFVDAETGAILQAESLVDTADRGEVFLYYPGAPSSPERVVRSFEGDNAASPHGWVGFSDVNATEDSGGGDSLTTAGNNASTFLNWSNFLIPADQANRPPAPLGQFNYPFTNSWNSSNCSAAPPGYAPDAHAATANLFYHHNLMHDFFYELGFTEAAGNMQVVNFTGKGEEGDPIQGLAQAGATTGGAPTYTGRDNAYMLTLPDGLPAWSGMFLWEPIDDAFEAPCVDGDFDSSVIYHEYTHAVTNRMVPDLSGHQAGAMGEAWSDFFALDYLQKENLYDGTALGEYVTGNKENGIRNWALAEKPVGFGDMGYDLTGPQVHADGEIWAGILWELRTQLMDKFGAEEGAQRARQAIVTAMPISAPEPSMVDMRDAIMAAGQALYNGDTNHRMWLAFASRGLGNTARSEGTGDTDPQPGFDHWWSASNVRVRGSVVNATTGEPVVDAKVILGQYEGRVTPVDRTDESGRFSFKALNTSNVGPYTLTIQSRGFGAQFHKLDLPWGSGPRDLAISLRPNLASVSNGATYETSSQGVAKGEAALDDTEATAWNSGEREAPINGSENKPSLTVTLAGDGSQTIDSLHVSAYKNTGSGRFIATRDYKVEASNNGGPFQTIATGLFDATKPRPTAPKLHYQVIRLPEPVAADRVRVTVLSVQGEDQVESELGELQVFGSDSGPLRPTGSNRPAPFTSEEHMIVGANPASDAVGGITENQFVASGCQYPPPSNGVDGWVFEIPDRLTKGNANVLSIGESNEATGHDFDLYFYSESCSSLGSAASSAANEAGAVPYGTKYIIVDQWLGAATQVHIKVSAAD